MSGVEAAGLVLGALPLIIEAIKVYSDGASTIRDYFRYRSPLTNLADELATERTLFENVCDELLDGLVEDSKWKADLLQNPGGDAWNDQQLEERLKSRLLGPSYEEYLKAMRDMKRAVAEVHKLLKLGPDGKVQINANNRFDKEKKKLKFSIKKRHYDSWVAQIRRSRERLNEITQHGLKVEARVRGPRTWRTARRTPDLDFSAVQKCAARVYNIIRCGLQCSCRSSHGINLQLEPQKKYTTPASCGPTQASFRVVFSYDAKGSSTGSQPWDIEAVEIYPDEDEANGVPHAAPKASAASATKARVVRFQDTAAVKSTDISGKDLASNMLNSFCISTSNVCLAQLFQGKRAVRFTHQLLSPQPGTTQPTNSFHSPTTNPDLIPLRKALLLNSTGRYRRRFSNLVRLRLSVTLAWSLLQLHQTPWFTETWGNSDINLLDRPNHTLLDQPFIRRTISENTDAQSVPTSHQTTSSGPRNRPLFALGVLQIELCLGAPFDKLREQQHLEALGLPDMCSDYEVADRLIDDVYDEFGDAYGDAVLKCVRCEFGCRRNSLDDERFKRAFYNGVIVLLEQNLEMFRSH